MTIPASSAEDYTWMHIRNEEKKPEGSIANFKN
jgi:hypothetical protein